MKNSLKNVEIPSADDYVTDKRMLNLQGVAVRRQNQFWVENKDDNV